MNLNSARQSRVDPIDEDHSQVEKAEKEDRLCEVAASSNSQNLTGLRIDDEMLLGYFRRGLIPGPEESEEAFLNRVQQATPLSHFEWNEVFSPFGFTIDWVPISYSNHQMAWWEGAATWISEQKIPLIQLRNNFQKGSFLGYQRSEILSHEAVHAARMRFEEPQFEEILAYATATKPWKRFFGPLFRTTWEPLLWLLVVLLGFFWPLIPLLFIGFRLTALSYRQRIFKRCCRRFPLSVVVCLTDHEMKAFAGMSNEEVIREWDQNGTLLSRLKKRLFCGEKRVEF